MNVQRYSPEHAIVKSRCVPDRDGDFMLHAEHLKAMDDAKKILQGTKDVNLAEIQCLNAALEAERAKGRVWWCLRAPSGCEWMYPNDPGIPKESGWTCRKVRVVEVEE